MPASYYLTGYYRMSTLRISKSTGGVLDPGYPKDYDIRDAFGAYSALGTNPDGIEELALLTDSEYNTRLADFRTYVEGLESGLALPGDSINSPTGYDEELCPPGGTPGSEPSDACCILRQELGLSGDATMVIPAGYAVNLVHLALSDGSTATVKIGLTSGASDVLAPVTVNSGTPSQSISTISIPDISSDYTLYINVSGGGKADVYVTAILMSE